MRVSCCSLVRPFVAGYEFSGWASIMTIVEIILLVLTTLLIFVLGGAAGYWYSRKRNPFSPAVSTSTQAVPPIPEMVALPDFIPFAVPTPSAQASASGDSAPNLHGMSASVLTDLAPEVTPASLPPVEPGPAEPAAMVLPLLEYLESTVQVSDEAAAAVPKPGHPARMERPAVPPPPRPAYQRLAVLDLTPASGPPPPPRPQHLQFTPLAQWSDKAQDAPSATGATPDVRPVNVLLQIRGVDEVLAARLGTLGITTLTQIAHFSSYEVRKLAEHLELPPEIIMQEWIPQAHLLVYSPTAT
jgi:predicted flap endonuclease-1-like 5' DNA nuclease